MAIRFDKGQKEAKQQGKKTKNMMNGLKDTAQTQYDKTKHTAKATYNNVQDGVNVGLSKTQAALIAGLGIAQGLISLNQQRTEKRLKQARKDARKTMKHEVRPRWEKAQDTLSSGLNTAQNTLSSGFESAQDIIAHNTKQAQKNLMRAQKNLKKSYQSMQHAAVPAISHTVDAFSKGTRQAGHGFNQAVGNVTDFKDSVQGQYKHYQRKRARARTLFRFGLVTGVILALLYAPYPGSEVRERIVAQWRKYRSSFGL